MQQNYARTGMEDWLSTDKTNIWHPFTPLKGTSAPLLITAAKGVYLHTADGRQIIDAISSWWVNLHGHSHPQIAEAVGKQAANLEHVIFAGFTHQPAITLSDNLLRILPDNQKKIFFSDNGSTAVEVALKMALQLWHNQQREKKKIIAFKGAYHGDTFGAMSVGARSLFTRPFTPFLFDVEFIDLPDDENFSAVSANFNELLATGDVACFIYEPLVQAAAGMKTYRAEYLDRLISDAQDEEVICIADEVFTGFGRTGRLFASDYLKQKPDLIALSKGLTGGTMAMGITSCSEKITAAFDDDRFDKTFFHGHSYTANPLACAAANASFDLLMSDVCRKQISMICGFHEKFAREINGLKGVREVRTLGTVLAIELDEGKTEYENKIRGEVYRWFLDRNILLRPLGNVMYVLPPYVITEAELNKVYEAIRDFLQSRSQDDCRR